MNYSIKLKNIIDKYKGKLYNELEFQDALSSIVLMITEYEYSEFRDSLQNLEGELELINYRFDEEYWKDKYLEVIDRIEELQKRMTL